MRRRTESMRYGFMAKISSKGQFTIPKVLRLKLGIKRGDKVEIEIADNDTFVVRPLKVVPAGKLVA